MALMGNELVFWRHSYKVEISIEFTGAKLDLDMVGWLGAEIKGMWGYMSLSSYVYFDSETDAMAFKLRWA